MTASSFSYVLGYGCVTAAGQGASALFDGLVEGRDHSAPLDASFWTCRPSQAARVCRIARSDQCRAVERLVDDLVLAFEEAVESLPAERRRQLASGLGVLLASTKGAIEDLVWNPNPEGMALDTLTPVLRSFLARTGLEPARSLAISNACSSVHAALRHASVWLRAGVVRDVLVLAADHAGPFVVNGFAALKSLAPERVTPFGAGRQGIQLGDAAAAILLSAEPAGGRKLRLGRVELLTEGHALTRSRADGATLHAVCDAVRNPGVLPQVVIAHGTGTEANDAMEDRVYRTLPGETLITCTKWSVGHALGASGAVDFVAAAEMLRRQTVFGIGNTEERDPALQANYLMRGQSRPFPGLTRVQLNSVGFGGMHASTLLEQA